MHRLATLLLFTFYFLLFTSGASAQGSYLPYDADIYHLIDRAHIMAGRNAPLGLGAQRPYTRQSIADLADSVNADSTLTERQRRLATRFLIADNSEFFADSLTRRKPVLRYLFEREADVFSVREPHFDLHVSPSFYGQFARERSGYTRSDLRQPYINTRGVEVRGTIDKRLSFYTFLADNQAIFPEYIGSRDYESNYAFGDVNSGRRGQNEFPRLPYEGYVKPLDPARPSPGFDFITARGHISFNATKHIHFQIGQDRLFSGYGMRSLILSDWAPAMPFVKAEVAVWKIKYSSIFAQVKAGGRRVNDDYIPNKWLAHHNLEVALLPNLHLNFFESVIYAPKDTNQRGVFELGYINPIIFYRFAEQYQGSFDNSLVGAGWRYDFLKHFRFYGQVVFDELRIENLRAQDGWWANKYALQAGLKYVNVLGVNGLDMQGEINVVRPFTYTHRTKFLNYTSYNLPMAHPLGANFTELVGRLDYQPHYRLGLHLAAMYVRGGDDAPRENFGSEIRTSYESRIKEFGNTIGQGAPYTTTLLDARLSYMPWHRVFIELGYLYRDKAGEFETASSNLNSHIVSLAVRWNIFYRQQWI